LVPVSKLNIVADEADLILSPSDTFVRHFSPLIGSALPTSDSKDAPRSERREKKRTTTSFIANRLQLTGPVPTSLRHSYVGYRPFIEWMFTKRGIKGRLLHRALHNQYASIYGYGKDTEWGVAEPSDLGESARHAFARKFLRMTSFGSQGRMFTYIITLDGEMRFTETGEEFLIELLSKHSMHADVAKEIAYSGEFFVRLMEGQEGQSEEIDEGEPQDENSEHYELVIDNDSGTYRPRKDLLPTLEEFLAGDDNFGGLGRVVTMDAFDETMEKWKEERKEAKREARGKEKGDGLPKMMQVRRGSSMSSVMSNVEKGTGRWCS